MVGMVCAYVAIKLSMYIGDTIIAVTTGNFVGPSLQMALVGVSMIISGLYVARSLSTKMRLRSRMIQGTMLIAGTILWQAGGLLVLGAIAITATTPGP